MLADPKTYLAPLTEELRKTWPSNRLVNIVCHGHSVPAGYFKTPVVDSFHAYPHLLHRALKEHFPHAVLNVIVTAIGGEESESGARRFEAEVLCHRPDLLLIDYSLNDRRLGLERAAAAWGQMIQAAQKKKVPLICCTPTLDNGDLVELRKHAAQVRELAERNSLGLADSFARWERTIAEGTPREALLSQSNHPNEAGHKLVVQELLRWFPGVERV
ncbi:SGNH/GDSL hydrolase family protein [Armatimonas rosea]|uniref:Lysophospholipase L1-like esterase n=1 Tax=Armatimonas rosea TaxID=685828 RepID=A0A7W9SND4_ARMRO|nr:SGNH/GDSL hydrolase family protein [Armatimonas rosea]MBB6049791.1 lysophospholipase L1-like esterase [Armatimonas rosea]